MVLLTSRLETMLLGIVGGRTFFSAAVSVLGRRRIVVRRQPDDRKVRKRLQLSINKQFEIELLSDCRHDAPSYR
jgi:hypothetical protein